MSDGIPSIKLQPLTEIRRRRRFLPPSLRYPLIASWGALLGIATFYLLRKLGY